MFINVNVIHAMNGAPYKRELLLFLHTINKDEQQEEISFVLSGLEIDMDKVISIHVEPFLIPEGFDLLPAMIVAPNA